MLYDQRLSSNAKVVYGVLARHGQDSWPSQARIGELVRLSRRSTQRALYELVEAGHIERIRRGRTLTNLYRVMRHQRASLPSDAPPVAQVMRHQRAPDAPPVAQGKRANEREPLNEKHIRARAANNGSEKGQDDVNVRVTLGSDGSAWVVDNDTDRIVGVATSEYTTAVTAATTSSRALAVSDAGFEAFWKVYPYKAGKIDARKAWGQALAKGADPRAIAAGAERYAGDPNREPQYTKMPAGWLRDGRWEDAPLPSRSNGTKHDRTRERIARLSGTDSNVIDVQSWRSSP